jgi:hypothetical protein
MSTDLVRFPDFRERILGDLKDAHPDSEIRADESEAILITSSKVLAIVSIDKLYRAYVDIALQSPDSSFDEVLGAAKDGVNNWFAASGESPVFSVERIPSKLGNVVLMQKCVATPPTGA